MGFGHLRAFPSRIRRQGPGNTSDAVARALSIGDQLITYIVRRPAFILDAVPDKGRSFALITPIFRSFQMEDCLAIKRSDDLFLTGQRTCPRVIAYNAYHCYILVLR